MKILFVSPEGPRDYEILGGRGIWLKNILPLVGQKHDVKILTWGESEKMPNYDIVGMDMIRLKPAPFEVVGEFKEDNFTFLKEFVNLFHTWKPDLIHLQDADAAEAALFIAQSYQIPLLYTVHLSAAACFISGFCRERYQQYLCQWEQVSTKQADRIHVCSDYYARKFYKGEGDPLKYWYFTDVPVSIVKNGVNVNDFNGSPDLRQPGEKFNVFFAGRFAKGKGIETICEIIEDMPDCKFHFAGQFNGTESQGKEYPTTKRLYELADQYPDRVVLFGHMEQPEMVSKARDMDVWLCPSWHCPFELVGLEAMATGVPVVLTKTGTFLEYGQHESNCLMVTPKSAEELKNAVYRIKSDRELAQKLVLNGLETVKNHSWQVVADGLDNVYQEMINGN